MTNKVWRAAFLSTVIATMLAGCNAVEADAPAAQQPGSSPPPQTASNNSQPSISGAPATSTVAGITYLFQPIATDSDGDRLAFTVAGLPAWARIDTQSGKVYGTPTMADIGTTANIVVSVSDGKTSVSLPAFTITVSPLPPTGTAALSWAAPTQNTDGSTATDLAGYRVYHGLAPDALNDAFQVPGAASTTYTVSQLASGTHYFAVAAYTSAGVEGARSAVGSKTIL
jgi:hypothetical protein